MADRQIRQLNWPVFGGLFSALGVPDDALIRFRERVPSMTRRPYSLLHTDLHRDNVIMSSYGEQPLICVDWELATYGDPVHDLATHLVRMRYTDYQWVEMVSAWVEEMTRVRPQAVRGYDRDLGQYVKFERAQSLYADVMRAAGSLVAVELGQKRLDEATKETSRALEAAAEPLGLRNVPDAREIENALLRWMAPWLAGRTRGRGATARTFDWKPDPRVPERPSFPHSAVRHALLAEGAAPAGRVFRGTAHLDSVASVPDIAFKVVVRRKVPTCGRHAHPCLSEPVVLRAIEQSGVPVMAPTLLALGESNGGDPFAIHTYLGQFDLPTDRPMPGLSRREAGGLVDQLCALTEVGRHFFDPVPAVDDFYGRLSEQLVELVAELPTRVMQSAKHRGLPNADQLRQILSGYKVTPRKPTLLHGALGPRSLVRRGSDKAPAIVHWENALFGDPLYDLVRHFFLMPPTPDTRAFILRRWTEKLRREYTVDGLKDLAAYHTIEVVRVAYAGLDHREPGAAGDSNTMAVALAVNALGLTVRPTANPHLVRGLG
jgi:aminoglycoside phosphotransferase (APT) family kinase protein